MDLKADIDVLGTTRGGQAWHHEGVNTVSVR